jgi:hypothetical protein
MPLWHRSFPLLEEEKTTMRVTRVGYALGIAAAVAVFAGCSSNGSSLGSIAHNPTMGGQSVVHNQIPVVLPARLMSAFKPGIAYKGGSSGPSVPDSVTTWIYECSFNTSVCRFYKKGHNVVVGTIGGLLNPQGIGVNPMTGNVYIADTGGADIQVFGPGSTTLIQDIPVTGQFPVDVAVDNQGNVYVANIFSQSGAPGSVDVFSASGSHLRHLTDPNVSEGISVSIDENHLLSFCFNNFSGFGECDLFPHAKGHGNVAESGWGFSGGNSFNNAEHTVVLDQLADAALTFSSGTECGSLSLTGAGDDVMMALSRNNGLLAEGDAVNENVATYPYSDCANGSASATKVYNKGITGSDLVIGAGITPGVKP